MDCTMQKRVFGYSRTAKAQICSRSSLSANRNHWALQNISMDSICRMRLGMGRVNLNLCILRMFEDAFSLCAAQTGLPHLAWKCKYIVYANCMRRAKALTNLNYTQAYVLALHMSQSSMLVFSLPFPLYPFMYVAAWPYQISFWPFKQKPLCNLQ